MESRLWREYLVELLGTLALVYVSAGVVLVHHMATPAGAAPALNGHQPGLVGIALCHALIWLAMVAWTVPVSGGYLNPAIALAMWLFGKLDALRLVWFIGAQVLGAVLAGFLLRLTFDAALMQAAQGGGPFLNPLAFAEGPHSQTASAFGTAFGIELLLTFFLVLAIFATPEKAPWAGAAVIAAAVLFAFPLTGAGSNPVRWLAAAFWQTVDHGPGGIAKGAALAYVAGPIAGALLAGLFDARVVEPARRARQPRP